MIIDKENNSIFIVEKLNSLKNKLNQDTINLESVKRDMQSISSYDNASNYAYLNSLLEPEKAKGTTIPSNIPVPTCSFQLHNYLTFKPADNGNDVFTFNPFFLSNDKFIGKDFNFSSADYTMMIGCGMYFFANSTREITGNTPLNDWYYPQAAMQNIPDVYSKYRLVSACCTVKYVGTLEEAKGVVGGGISYIKSPYIGLRFKLKDSTQTGSGSRNPMLSEYGDFELIRDCYYHQENLCLEGIRMLYFPLDNSFEEFKEVWDGTIEKTEPVTTDVGSQPAIRISDKYFKSGFNWFLYTKDAPPSASRNFRFDFYLNFECLPKPEFLNYMPISLSLLPRITLEMKNKFLEEVRDKAITKIYNKFV
ncbi:MAG: hypothetical protein J6T10_16325 [Methanobrevibacter sp.]|nr:hypothetical protein [Methanobrevibacter sp.]